MFLVNKNVMGPIVTVVIILSAVNLSGCGSGTQETIINQDPKITSLHNAYDLFKEREYSEAISILNRLIEEDDRFINAYLYRASCYIELGDLDVAMSDCNMAIELDELNSDAYMTRGNLYIAMSAYEESISDCDKALDLDPYSAYAYAVRGLANYCLMRFEEAIEDCTNAINYDKYPSPYRSLVSSDGFVTRGNAYIQLGRYDDAIANYSECLLFFENSSSDLEERYSSGLAYIYEMRAWAYFQTDRYDESIQDCEKAIGLDPYNAAAYATLGASRAYIGQYEEAIADCNKSIEIDASIPLPYFIRGTAYAATGQADQAIRDLERTLEIDPGYEMAKRMLHDIGAPGY